MSYQKCVLCANVDFCAMYTGMVSIAGLLNRNLENSVEPSELKIMVEDCNGTLVDEKSPFTNIVDTMAKDCKRFKPINYENSS